MKLPYAKTIVPRRLLASAVSLSIVALVSAASFSLTETGIPADVSTSLMENAGITHQARLESEKFEEEVFSIEDLHFTHTSNLPDDDTSEMIPISAHEPVVTEVIESNETPSSIESNPTQEQSQYQESSPQPQGAVQTVQQQPVQPSSQQAQLQPIASASAPLSIPQATSQLISQRSRTIRIAGEEIPYAYSRASATAAPESGCAIWKGLELTDDSDYCYFVGHNPGPFHAVMELQPGDRVTVCDLNKKIRSYTIRYAFIVPQRSTYADIADKVEGHGESVILQTCCGDNVNVRIVVAW